MNTTIQFVVASFVGSFIIIVVVTLIVTKRCRKKVVIDKDRLVMNRMSMSEVAAATDHFSEKNIIGDGSFGVVYKGHIPDQNLDVAVKRRRGVACIELRQFRAELEALRRLQHQNIVPLVGYVVSGFDRIIVYEFMENGSLEQWLHNGEENRLLSWEARIKILKGVARGLLYLHDGLETPMIHRDIKPGNILLDSDLNARITDFGLARSIFGKGHVSTIAAGSVGYMAPEYLENNFPATKRVDVYSFGVTVIESLTGKSPTRPVSTRYGKLVSLVEWFREMMENQCTTIHEMVDPSVPMQGLVEAQVEECFKIALLCVTEYARDSPTMAQVVHMLNQIPI